MVGMGPTWTNLCYIVHMDMYSKPSPDDDLGVNMDNPSGPSSEQSLAHQGDELTGGISDYLKVLHCSNLDFGMNFEEVELLARQFGEIEKIRLLVAESGKTLNAYIVFKSSAAAGKAHSKLNGHKVSDLVLQTCLFNVRNLKDDPFDYYPKSTDMNIERKAPVPIWFVAKYKEGTNNFLKASETLNKTLNGIPPNNLKRYGKNILIKAKNLVQGKLLESFKPSTNSNIQSITPHRSFNSVKGVIFSKDLHELSEEEILQRSQSNVYEIKKFRGTNHAILLVFSTEHLPDYVSFGDHVRMRVRRFRPNPKQCRKCFEYGHFSDNCHNTQRCPRCSATHNLCSSCNKQYFCYLCDGQHSPMSNECPRRKFEREILETADVEHISIGSAKRQVMGANTNPHSSYANIIKNIKSSNIRENRNKVNTQHILNSSLPSSLPDLASSSPNASTSKTSSVHAISESTSLSSKSLGTKPKLPSKQAKKKSNSGGFQLPPKQKRSRPSSPNKPSIEITNRFEALDPFSPLLNTRPLKRMAMSSSCSDINTLKNSEHSTSSLTKASVPSCSSLTADAADPDIAASVEQKTSKSNSNSDIRSCHHLGDGSQQSSHKSKSSKLARSSVTSKIIFDLKDKS